MISRWAKAKTDGSLKRIPPRVEQRKDWTCGPAALRAALKQAGHKPPGEDEIARLASTSREEGTTPANMAKAAKALGATAEVKRLDGPGELAALADKRAVILDIQSFDEPASGWKGGHYVVLSRAKAGGIEVMDPMGGDTKALTYDALVKRWHDEEANGKRNTKLVILVG